MFRGRLAFGVLVLALIPSARLAWQARDMPHFGHYHDDGLYWVTAKSLATNAGYRILSLPQQPYQTKYPPLYPLVLSWVWKVNPSFPGNLTLALWLNWLAFPICVVLVNRLLQKIGMGPVEALIGCAVLVLSPAICILSITLMSDIPCCCLLFGSLLLVQRTSKVKSGLLLAGVAGLLGAAAYLTRVAALPLLVVVPLWFFLRRQHRHAAIFFAVMAPAVLGWLLWTRVHVSPSSDPTTLYYTSYYRFLFNDLSWRDLPLVAWKNTHSLLASISQLFVYKVDSSFSADFAWRLLAFAAIAGSIRLARQTGVTPYHLFAAAFVPMVLVCNWPPDERSLLPIFPLLIAGLWTELRHLLQMLHISPSHSTFAHKAVVGGIWIVLSVSAFLMAYFNSDALFRFLPGIMSQHRRLLADEVRAFEWMSRNIPGDATFLAYNDPALYLYTGNRASGIRAPGGIYYKEGVSAFQNVFYSLDDFARSHGLNYIFATAGDFHRGELPPDQRIGSRQRLASAHRATYESEMTFVYDIRTQHRLEGRP